MNRGQTWVTGENVEARLSKSRTGRRAEPKFSTRSKRTNEKWTAYSCIPLCQVAWVKLWSTPPLQVDSVRISSARDGRIHTVTTWTIRNAKLDLIFTFPNVIKIFWIQICTPRCQTRNFSGLVKTKSYSQDLATLLLQNILMALVRGLQNLNIVSRFQPHKISDTGVKRIIRRVV